jgi:hypothetical protein
VVKSGERFGGLLLLQNILDPNPSSVQLTEPNFTMPACNSNSYPYSKRYLILDTPLPVPVDYASVCVLGGSALAELAQIPAPRSSYPSL